MAKKVTNINKQYISEDYNYNPNTRVFNTINPNATIFENLDASSGKKLNYDYSNPDSWKLYAGQNQSFGKALENTIAGAGIKTWAGLLNGTRSTLGLLTAIATLDKNKLVDASGTFYEGWAEYEEELNNLVADKYQILDDGSGDIFNNVGRAFQDLGYSAGILGEAAIETVVTGGIGSAIKSGITKGVAKSLGKQSAKKTAEKVLQDAVTSSREIQGTINYQLRDSLKKGLKTTGKVISDSKIPLWNAVKETFQNGEETSNNVKQQLLSKGYSEEQATEYARKVGLSTMWSNLGTNLLLNTITYGTLTAGLKQLDKYDDIIRSVKNGAKTQLGGAMSDAFEPLLNKLTKNINNKTASTIASLGTSMLSEGIEEGTQTLLSNLNANTLYKELNQKRLFNEITQGSFLDIDNNWKDVGYSMFSGALGGAILGGGFKAINKGINKLRKTDEKLDAQYTKNIQYANELLGQIVVTEERVKNAELEYNSAQTNLEKTRLENNNQRTKTASQNIQNAERTLFDANKKLLDLSNELKTAKTEFTERVAGLAVDLDVRLSTKGDTIFSDILTEQYEEKIRLLKIDFSSLSEEERKSLTTKANQLGIDLTLSEEEKTNRINDFQNVIDNINDAKVFYTDLYKKNPTQFKYANTLYAQNKFRKHFEKEYNEFFKDDTDKFTQALNEVIDKNFDNYKPIKNISIYKQLLEKYNDEKKVKETIKQLIKNQFIVDLFNSKYDAENNELLQSILTDSEIKGNKSLFNFALIKEQYDEELKDIEKIEESLKDFDRTALKRLFDSVVNSSSFLELIDLAHQKNDYEFGKRKLNQITSDVESGEFFIKQNLNTLLDGVLNGNKYIDSLSSEVIDNWREEIRLYQENGYISESFSQILSNKLDNVKNKVDKRIKNEEQNELIQQEHEEVLTKFWNDLISKNSNRLSTDEVLNTIFRAGIISNNKRRNLEKQHAALIEYVNQLLREDPNNVEILREDTKDQSKITKIRVKHKFNSVFSNTLKELDPEYHAQIKAGDSNTAQTFEIDYTKKPTGLYEINDSGKRIQFSEIMAKALYAEIENEALNTQSQPQNQSRSQSKSNILNTLVKQFISKDSQSAVTSFQKFKSLDESINITFNTDGLKFLDNLFKTKESEIIKYLQDEGLDINSLTQNQFIKLIDHFIIDNFQSTHTSLNNFDSNILDSNHTIIINAIDDNNITDIHYITSKKIDEKRQLKFHFNLSKPDNQITTVLETKVSDTKSNTLILFNSNKEIGDNKHNLFKDCVNDFLNPNSRDRIFEKVYNTYQNLVNNYKSFKIDLAYDENDKLTLTTEGGRNSKLSTTIIDITNDSSIQVSDDVVMAFNDVIENIQGNSIDDFDSLAIEERTILRGTVGEVFDLLLKSQSDLTADKILNVISNQISRNRDRLNDTQLKFLINIFSDTIAYDNRIKIYFQRKKKFKTDIVKSITKHLTESVSLLDNLTFPMFNSNIKSKNETKKERNNKENSKENNKENNKEDESNQLELSIEDYYNSIIDADEQYEYDFSGTLKKLYNNNDRPNRIRTTQLEISVSNTAYYYIEDNKLELKHNEVQDIWLNGSIANNTTLHLEVRDNDDEHEIYYFIINNEGKPIRKRTTWGKFKAGDNPLRRELTKNDNMYHKYVPMEYIADISGKTAPTGSFLQTESFWLKNSMFIIKDKNGNQYGQKNIRKKNIEKLTDIRLSVNNSNQSNSTKISFKVRYDGINNEHGKAFLVPFPDKKSKPLSEARVSEKQDDLGRSIPSVTLHRIDDNTVYTISSNSSNKLFSKNFNAFGFIPDYQEPISGIFYEQTNGFYDKTKYRAGLARLEFGTYHPYFVNAIVDLLNNNSPEAFRTLYKYISWTTQNGNGKLDFTPNHDKIKSQSFSLMKEDGIHITNYFGSDSENNGVREKILINQFGLVNATRQQYSFEENRWGNEEPIFDNIYAILGRTQFNPKDDNLSENITLRNGNVSMTTSVFNELKMTLKTRNQSFNLNQENQLDDKKKKIPTNILFINPIINVNIDSKTPLQHFIDDENISSQNSNSFVNVSLTQHSNSNVAIDSNSIDIEKPKDNESQNNNFGIISKEIEKNISDRIDELKSILTDFDSLIDSEEIASQMVEELVVDDIQKNNVKQYIKNRLEELKSNNKTSNLIIYNDVDTENKSDKTLDTSIFEDDSFFDESAQNYVNSLIEHYIVSNYTNTILTKTVDELVKEIQENVLKNISINDKIAYYERLQKYIKKNTSLYNKLQNTIDALKDLQSEDSDLITQALQNAILLANIEFTDTNFDINADLKNDEESLENRDNDNIDKDFNEENKIYDAHIAETNPKQKLSLVTKSLLTGIPSIEANTFWSIGTPVYNFYSFDELYNLLRTIIFNRPEIIYQEKFENNTYKDSFVLLVEQIENYINQYEERKEKNDSLTLDEQDTLDKLTAIHSKFNELLNNKSNGEYATINAIMTDFSKRQLKMKYLFIDSSNRINLYTVDSNSQYRKIRNSWYTNFTQGIDFDSEEVKSKINKLIDKINSNVLRDDDYWKDVKDLYAQFGIEVSIETLKQYDDLGTNQQYGFLAALLRKNNAKSNIINVNELSTDTESLKKLFSKYNTHFNDLIQIESSQSLTPIAPTEYDSGKTLNMFVIPDYASIKTSDILYSEDTQEYFKKQSYYPYWIYGKKLYQGEDLNEHTPYYNNFELLEASKLAIRNSNQSIDSTVENYTNADLFLYRFGLYEADKNTQYGTVNLQNKLFNVKKGYYSFDTLSDKGRPFIFSGLNIEFYNPNKESVTIDEVKQFASVAIFENSVIPELTRIIDVLSKSKTNTLNWDGMNTAGKLITSFPALNTILYGKAFNLIDFINNEDNVNLSEKELINKLLSNSELVNSFIEKINKILNDESNALSEKYFDKNFINNINIEIKNKAKEKVKGTDNEQHKAILISFIANNYMAKSAMSIFYSLDPAQYAHDKKISKAIGVTKNISFNEKLQSGDLTETHYQNVLDLINTERNKRLAGLSGSGNILNFASPNYREIIVEDRNGLANNIDYLVHLFVPNEENKDEILNRIDNYKKAVKTTKNEEELNELRSKLQEDLLQYSELKELFPYIDNTSTDAQEYTTLREAINILYSAGKINDEKYKQLLELDTKRREFFNSPENKEKPLPNDLKLTQKDLALVIQPMKPVYYGDTIDSQTGLQRIVYVKSSAIPLLSEFTDGLEIDTLREALEKCEDKLHGNMIDADSSYRIAFVSAVKTGSVSKPFKLYDINGHINKSADELVAEFTESNKYYTELNRKHFKLQQEIHEHKSLKIANPTQMMKIIMSNIVSKVQEQIFEYKNSKVNGEILTQEYWETIDNLFEVLTHRFLQEFELNADGTINDEKKFFEKIKDALIKEAVRRKFSISEIKKLKVVEYESNGKNKYGFLIPLWASLESDRYEALLHSIFNKSLIKYKEPGYAYVATTDTGFFRSIFTEDNDPIETEKQLRYRLHRSGIVWVTNQDGSLKFKGKLDLTHVENGVLKPNQILVPFKFKDKNGKLIRLKNPDGTWNEKYVKQNKTTGILTLQNVDEELLQLPGFRIPTSSHVSSTGFEIVGFLPEEMGDSIVVSDNLNVQMGMDYDIDKLYLLHYHTHVNHITGRISKVDDKIVKDKSAIKTNQKIQLIQNDLVELYKSVLFNPADNIQRLINGALSIQLARNTTSVLNKLVSKSNTDDVFLRQSPYSIETDISNFESGSVGKVSIGMYSNAVVNYAILQQLKKPLEIDFTQIVDSKSRNTLTTGLIIGDKKFDGFLDPIQHINQNSRTITEALAERQNMATDNAKENLLYPNGLTLNTIPMDITLLLLGLDLVPVNIGSDTKNIQFSFLFFRNPYIQELIKSKSSKSVLNPKYKEIVSPTTLNFSSLTGNQLYKWIENPDTITEEDKFVLEQFYNFLDALTPQINIITQFIGITKKGLGTTFKEGQYQIDKLNRILKQTEGFAFTNLLPINPDEKLTATKLLEKLETAINTYSNAESSLSDFINNPLVKHSVKVKELYSKFFNQLFLQGNEDWNRIVDEFGNEIKLSASKQQEFKDKFFKEYSEFLYTSEDFPIFKSYDISQSRLAYDSEHSLIDLIRQDLIIDNPEHQSLAMSIKEILNNLQSEVQDSILNDVRRNEIKAVLNNPLLKNLQFSINRTGNGSYILFNKINDDSEEELYNAFQQLFKLKNTEIGIRNNKPYTAEMLSRDLIVYALLNINNPRNFNSFVKYIPTQILINDGWINASKVLNQASQTKNNTRLRQYFEQFIQHNINLVPSTTSLLYKKYDKFDVKFILKDDRLILKFNQTNEDLVTDFKMLQYVKYKLKNEPYQLYKRIPNSNEFVPIDTLGNQYIREYNAQTKDYRHHNDSNNISSEKKAQASLIRLNRANIKNRHELLKQLYFGYDPLMSVSIDYTRQINQFRTDNKSEEQLTYQLDTIYDLRDLITEKMLVNIDSTQLRYNKHLQLVADLLNTNRIKPSTRRIIENAKAIFVNKNTNIEELIEKLSVETTFENLDLIKQNINEFKFDTNVAGKTISYTDKENDKKNIILLKSDNGSISTDKFGKTMLHELIHAVTAQTLYKYFDNDSNIIQSKLDEDLKKGNIPKAIYNAFFDLKTSFDIAKTHYNNDTNTNKPNEHYFISIHEFVSELISNPDFDNYLFQIKLNDNQINKLNNKSLFQKLIGILKKIIDNAFSNGLPNHQEVSVFDVAFSNSYLTFFTTNPNLYGNININNLGYQSNLKSNNQKIANAQILQNTKQQESEQVQNTIITDAGSEIDINNAISFDDIDFKQRQLVNDSYITCI